MVALDPAALHDSLRDPVLGSIGFLNEVMGRYPDAISFAPGAPHPDFHDELDVHRYVERFLDHLVRVEGHDPERARRLLYEYGPARGLINGIVAEALRRDQGIDVPPAAIVITVGAQEAMLLALRALFGSSRDLLAVASPCFVGIVGAARLLDVGVVPVRETEHGIDLEALTEACRTARRDGHRVRACHLAPDFANPGGGRMSLDHRRDLLRLAQQEELLLIEDNTYGFTAAPTDELPSLKALDIDGRVLHIGTFAKTCFPAARVGYIVADQPITAENPSHSDPAPKRSGRTGLDAGPTGLDARPGGLDARPGGLDAGHGGERLLATELAALKSMITVNTAPLSQAAVAGFLLEHGGSLAEPSHRRAAIYRRNLACLLAALDRHLGEPPPAGVTWNRPEGGFFVRVRLPVPVDLDLLEVSAAKYGVLWTPMAPFYLDGGGDHQLRLSCSYLDPEQIETGVRRLADFIREEIGV
ncbi:hypothetical protein GCM10022254_63270 [Actinomadura meridiana]|uniref:Aminotransferase class I/classII large domain-containing protein n=1 Tax=Actinomadura meridiana TaxID=559626 RepID=A0ABP8CJE3_9ACTN